MAENTKQLQESRAAEVSLKRRNAQLAIQWQERHEELLEYRTQKECVKTTKELMAAEIELVRIEMAEEIEIERKKKKELQCYKEELATAVEQLNHALDAAASNESRLHAIWTQAIQEAEMAEMRASAAEGKMSGNDDVMVMLRAALTVKEGQILELNDSQQELTNALALEVSKRVHSTVQEEEKAERKRAYSDSWNLW